MIIRNIMKSRQKAIIAAVVLVIAGVAVYVFGFRESMRTQRAEEVKRQVEQQQSEQKPISMENVSLISGLPCENMKKRPVAVMQPVDMQARPVAGFSQADMVFEMPNPAAGVFTTRLMGVYQCEIPDEIGSIRSARHDYISVAKGLDAIFVGWGGSAFAIKKLNDNVIDNIDCNGQGGKKAPQCCFRKEATGIMRGEDTGYVKGQKILECAAEFGYRSETKFAGYPHQEDAPADARPAGGRLRFGFPGIMEVEYDYDKETNSYLRIWGGKEDFDRNNQKRIAPKNVVLVVAENEQIMAEANYTALGVEDPWAGLEEWERKGPKNISGRYNNIQLGDPWFDTKESGEARYYFNGQELRGTWKKSRSSAESKLTFFDASGAEVKFVPGQIWVEVMVPGQAFSWQPA